MIVTGFFTCSRGPVPEDATSQVLSAVFYEAVHIYVRLTEASSLVKFYLLFLVEGGGRCEGGDGRERKRNDGNKKEEGRKCI